MEEEALLMEKKKRQRLRVERRPECYHEQFGAAEARGVWLQSQREARSWSQALSLSLWGAD